MATVTTDSTSDIVKEEENKYINPGRELLKNYKQLYVGDTVRMFPQIISHSSIEKGAASKNYEDYRESSEAELEVFTLFKKMLKKPEYKGFILIHSFYYDVDILNNLGITSGEVFDKKRKQIEHDLLMMIPNNVFVVVEVKNSTKSSGCANKQLKTAERFIQSICLKHEVKQPIVLKVRAFSSTYKPVGPCNQVQPESTSSQNYFTLYKDTIKDQSEFSDWWDRNIVPQIQPITSTDSAELFNVVQELCVGIWASVNKDKQTVVDIVDTIDQRLREADLSQGKNNRVMTRTIAPLIDDAVGGNQIPEEVIAPDVQAFISGSPSNPIKYLTAEQLEVLSDDQYKHCIIRGPGGSGKTVAMLINVVRLSLKTGEEKLPIVILAHNEVSAKLLEKALVDYKVKVKLCCLESVNEEYGIDFNKDDDDVLIIYIGMLSWPPEDDVRLMEKIFERQGPLHLFIDNLQEYTFVMLDFANILSRFSAKQHVWLLCDDIQDPGSIKTVPTPGTSAQNSISEYKTLIGEKTFTKVVRSTKEIADASLALRNVIHDFDTEELRDIFKIRGCEPFHLIHGPKPFMHIIQYSENIIDSIKSYIGTFKQDYERIGDRSGILEAILSGSKIKKKQLIDTESNFTYLRNEFSLAHEFTAVLGIISAVKGKDENKFSEEIYRHIYLILSRARVIADVIIICDGFDFNTKPFEELFEISNGII